MILLLDAMQVDTKLSHFFKGYQEGQIGEDGSPQILRLKDWPSSTLFNYLVPRHSWEFISSLPFKEYTHPYSGYLNLAVMLSDGVLKPDLRPKMHISYGVAPELEHGDSVTKLRYNMCDTVSISFLTARHFNLGNLISGLHGSDMSILCGWKLLADATTGLLNMWIFLIFQHDLNILALPRNSSIYFCSWIMCPNFLKSFM